MNLSYENKVWSKGSRFVIGLDEAGRGPLAGPVTAAAVSIQKRPDLLSSLSDLLKEVNDSKKLSLKKREKLYDILTDHPYIFWEVSWVTPQVIDRINILEATRRAMKRAVERLERKIGSRSHFLFLDGNFLLDIKRRQKAVKAGDSKVFSCASASIIAKVWRDKTMRRYHTLFPEYGFNRHKGYPTKLHRKRLEKHGPCRIHRMSFRLT